MLVGEIMIDAATVELDSTIAEAASRMNRTGDGCLVVLNNGYAVGTITDRNVALGCPVEGHIPWECPVFRHMTIQTDTAHPDMDTETATIFMIENGLDCLPVIEGGELVGIVYADHISRANEREFSFESDFMSMIGVE